jgi:hypothetical protein
VGVDVGEVMGIDDEKIWLALTQTLTLIVMVVEKISWMSIYDAECCTYVMQFAREYFTEKNRRPTWGSSFLSFEQSDGL